MWQPQVEILLKLKKQLADLQTAPSKSLPNGDVKTDKAALEAEITTQGLLVRELKAKEDKSVWQPQVEILLKLKKKLAEIGGGPVPATSNEKKSKKKK